MLLIEYVVAGIVSIWFTSIEYRIREMRNKNELKPTSKEVKELIDLKQSSIIINNDNMKEDIDEIKDKIDKMYDILLKGK